MLRVLVSFAVVAAASAQGGKIASDAAGNVVITAGSTDGGGNNVIFSMDGADTSVTDILASLASLGEETGANLVAIGDMKTEIYQEIGGDLAALEEKVNKDIGAKLSALIEQTVEDKAALNAQMATLTQSTEGKLNGLTNKVASDLATTKSQITSQINALESKVNTNKQEVAAALAEATPVCKKPPTSVGGKKLSPSSDAKSDYDKGFYPVGMVLQFSGCPAKTFLAPGSADIECTGSKKWCRKGLGICASDQLNVGPKCSACPSGCTTCTASNNCQKCTNAGYMFVGGKCIQPKSCHQMFKSGGMANGQSKDVTLGKIKQGGTVKAKCSMEGGRIHTMIKCRDLRGGSSCRNFYRFNHGNTCKDYGYQNMPFRNQAHWRMGWDTYGSGTMRSYHNGVGGVYKTGSHGRYTGCAMRSGSCSSWQAPDGKLWFVKNSGYSEPNGDYHAWCVLDAYGWDRNDGMRFNDGWCGAWMGSSYFCGTSDYDGKGFPST